MQNVRNHSIHFFVSNKYGCSFGLSSQSFITTTVAYPSFLISMFPTPSVFYRTTAVIKTGCKLHSLYKHITFTMCCQPYFFYFFIFFFIYFFFFQPIEKILVHFIPSSLIYLLTYLLTPWSRVLLEKLASLQLVKKFPTFYGTRRFLTALTSARHLSLS